MTTSRQQSFQIHGTSILREPIERLPLQDGTVLDGYWVRPEDKDAIHATLFLGHAMMVDCAVLDRPVGGGLASHLASQGVAVAAINYRGHTTRGPYAGPNGYDWGYDDLVLTDTPEIVAWLREQMPDKPLFVGGHSLAGHVSLASLGLGLLGDVRGWVGFAANIWGKRYESSRARWLLKRSNIELFARMIAWSGYFDTARWGMGYIAEAQTYLEDLIRYAREDRWMSRDGEMDFEYAAMRVRVPVLFVTGDEDKLFGHVDGVKGFMRGVGSTQMHLHVRSANGKSADHMGVVLHDVFANTWRSVGEWIVRQAQA